MPPSEAPARYLPPVSRPAAQAAIGPFLRRLGFLVAMITGLVAFGTVGFVVTEDVSAWRGFLWTMDTIATVGSVPQADSTAGQALKVVLITLGVGTLFYALVTVTEFFVAGHLTGLLDERRTLKMIDSLSGHHLICGFGRVGRQIARDLRAAGEDVVVIDHDPANRELAVAIGVPFVEGEPAEDETLRSAGVERAGSVIACVDSDAENIFVTLTARELRPDVTIVARASADDSEKKLHRAGADRVISPYKTSGTEMARLALHPHVPVAVDVSPEYRMEEIEAPGQCEAIGVPLGMVKGAATIVALHRVDGEIELEPPPYATVAPGDVLVAVGDDAAMSALEAKFAPQPASG